MGFFDQASKKFAAVQKKTGDTIAVYKLQSQIKNAEEDVQRIYAAIGEICYAAHKTGKAPEGLESLFENIDRMNASISELRDEIDMLNNIVRCPNCDGSVEIGVKFCSKCGFKMPEELLPQVETCPNCGNVRGEGDRFCENCGHPFSAAAADIPVENTPENGEEA